MTPVCYTFAFYMCFFCCSISYLRWTCKNTCHWFTEGVISKSCRTQKICREAYPWKYVGFLSIYIDNVRYKRDVYEGLDQLLYELRFHSFLKPFDSMIMWHLCNIFCHTAVEKSTHMIIAQKLWTIKCLPSVAHSIFLGVSNLYVHLGHHFFGNILLQHTVFISCNCLWSLNQAEGRYKL